MIKGRIVFLVLLAVAASFTVSALEGEGYTTYESDFIEGTNLTKGMAVLDKLMFTYYDANYTLRVLGITSSSSLVRVGNKGVEINVGDSHSFNIDGGDDDDITITVNYADSEIANYIFQLHKKPSDEPLDTINETNTTNTTDTTNTANITSLLDNPNDSPSFGSPNLSLSPPITGASVAENTTPETPFESINMSGVGDIIYSPKYSFNGTSVNININVYFPEGWFIGLLLVIVIVLAGLVAYRKVSMNKEAIKDSAMTAWDRIKDAKDAIKGVRVVREKVKKKR